MYVRLDDHTWLYKVQGSEVIRETVPQLLCNHKEADTRLIFHAKHVSDTQPESNLVVRCNDTDILINFLSHIAHLSVHVWLDVGKSSYNSRHYIDVNNLASTLSPQLCNALPGYHAFTGNYYTATFFNKGKVRPLGIMEKSYIQAFAKLGVKKELDPVMVTDIEAFVSDVQQATHYLC